MRITEVTHERVKNLGNYESARVTLTMALDEGDHHRDALAVLKAEAYAFLYPKKDDDNDKKPITDDCPRNDVDDTPY